MTFEAAGACAARAAVGTPAAIAAAAKSEHPKTPPTPISCLRSVQTHSVRSSQLPSKRWSVMAARVNIYEGWDLRSVTRTGRTPGCADVADACYNLMRHRTRGDGYS